MSDTQFATISAAPAPFARKKGHCTTRIGCLVGAPIAEQLRHRTHNPPIRYAIALALTASALLGRWMLVPFLGDHVPFALIYGSVVLAALYLGLGPSIISSVAGIVCVRLFFAPQFFVITSVRELSETLTYIGGCVLIVFAAEAIRRSSDRLKLQTVNSPRRRKHSARSANS